MTSPRSTRERKKYSRREYPPDMVALLKLPTRQWQLFHRIDERGPTVLIGVSPTFNMIDLCALTVKELEAMRSFFERAFADALPFCQELDRLAEEARQRGDIRHRRLYRPDPIYAEMESNSADRFHPSLISELLDDGGAEREHEDRVQEGLPRVPDVEGDEAGDAGVARD